MAAIDIILIAYHDKAPEVSEVIERIYHYTSAPFKLTIIDNKSEGRIGDYLLGLRKKRSNITLVRNGRNMYACYATNQGLRLSNAPYIFYFCAHECFIMDSGWEEDCIRFMEDNPEIGLAGHLVQSPVYPTGAKYLEQSWFKHFRNPDFAKNNLERQFHHVQGGFFVLRKKMFGEIGGFNESIVHAAMDIEYSYYVESTGWKLGDIPSVFVVFETTRPNIEHYDPKIKIYHPLTLEKLKGFEKIRRGSLLTK